MLRENAGGEHISKAALVQFLQHEYEVGVQHLQIVHCKSVCSALCCDISCALLLTSHVICASAATLCCRTLMARMRHRRNRKCSSCPLAQQVCAAVSSHHRFRVAPACMMLHQLAGSVEPILHLSITRTWPAMTSKRMRRAVATPGTFVDVLLPMLSYCLTCHACVSLTTPSSCCLCATVW